MQETRGTSAQSPDTTNAEDTTPLIDPLSFHILMYLKLRSDLNVDYALTGHE